MALPNDATTADTVFEPWWRIGRRFMAPHMHSYKSAVARVLVDQFEPGWSVLDVGCDDGSLATLIQREQPTVEFQGVDIQSLRPCKIPRAIYDGRTLPFADNSFDAVMAVDMLHHTKHIDVLVSEMARVARHCVIVKDHLTSGWFSWLLVAFGDAMTNIPYGIPCAYNFPSLPDWLRIFERSDLHLASFNDQLQLNGCCIAKYNPLFRLLKASSRQEWNAGAGNLSSTPLQVVGGSVSSDLATVRT